LFIFFGCFHVGTWSSIQNIANVVAILHQLSTRFNDLFNQKLFMAIYSRLVCSFVFGIQWIPSNLFSPRRHLPHSDNWFYMYLND
jgi:hypothetical protein